MMCLMAEGWVAIWRKLTEHWLWNEDRPKTRLEAWIDIILMAQHSEKPQPVPIKDRILYCEYGQSIKSLDTWASRWQWNKSKVRRFFKLLEKEGNIVTVNETVTTRLIVCNYEQYDAKRQKRVTVTETHSNATETHSTPDKNDKNGNNEKKKKKRVVKSVDLPPEFDEFVTKFYNEYIMAHYPKSTTKIESERKAVRLLLNKDYKLLSEYNEVLNFLQNDSFWRGNIQCITKLTKIKNGVRYFDTILNRSRELKLTTDKGKSNSQKQPVTIDESRLI